jgi:hypothetical protein
MYLLNCIKYTNFPGNYGYKRGTGAEIKTNRERIREEEYSV